MEGGWSPPAHPTRHTPRYFEADEMSRPNEHYIGIIRGLAKSGFSASQVAKALRMRVDAIKKIWEGETWRGVEAVEPSRETLEMIRAASGKNKPENPWDGPEPDVIWKD